MTNLRFGEQVFPGEVAQEAFLRSREGQMGHPTCPGLRDEYVRRVGLPSPGNGSPGLPRYTALADHYPGIVRGTNGTKMPGVAYDNPEGEDRGDT